MANHNGNGGRTVVQQPPTQSAITQPATPARKDELLDVLFAELKSKIAAGIEIKPGANYLLLVKRGTLDQRDKDVFISLWRRNLNTGLLLFEVDDPETAVRVVEMEVGVKA